MLQNIGKYKVVKLLGAGGFGAVYLADDQKLHVQVAIKVFQVKNEQQARQATSASFDAIGVLKQRFVDEARILRKLSVNPYIVEVYDLDEMSDGTPYYVMPYLPHSLADELGKDAFTQGTLEHLAKNKHPKRLAPSQAIGYLKELLEALSAVHQAGLIHRDIKPDNVLLNEQGQVQLCDFGIAKLAHGSESESGVAMGSRNYMSPEQKESAKHVKASSDVYSVAALAYRMLTGQLPVARFQDPIFYAPEIGPAVNALILAALSQAAGDRPWDATQFLNQLYPAIQHDEQGSPDNIGDIEQTATWQGSSASIKTELKPLQQQIERQLFTYGEVSVVSLEQLKPLSAIAGLDSQALTAFIKQLENQHADKITALKTWLLMLDQQIKDSKGKLDAKSIQTINSSGAALGKNDDFINARIAEQQAWYQQQTAQTHSAHSQEPVAGAIGLSHYLTKHKLPRQFGLLLLIGLIGLLIVIIDKSWWPTEQQSVTVTPFTSEVRGEDLQNIPGQAALLPLTIISMPAQAHIDIAGYGAVISANATHLAQGEYQITVSQAGYISQTKLIRLSGEQALVETINLQPQLYPLQIATAQPDASILVDDNRNYTPDMLLPYGQHKLSISKPGYVSQSILIQLDDKHSAFSFQLERILPKPIKALLDGLVQIPAGDFIMGLQGQQKEQKPAFKVNIKTFSLMSTEVTFAMWQSCVSAGSCSHVPFDEGWGKEDRPVINVSWFDIVEQFIPWLNRTTQHNFRLPSEAEWEYAARSGSQGRYSWGSQINCRNARYGFYTKQCGKQKSTDKVRSYQANAFGLYDMHGNVYEWVQDCWNDNYNGAPSNGEARLSGDCQRSVLRGGSWINDAKSLTLVVRNRHDRKARLNFYGFRLVQTSLPDATKKASQ